MRPIEKPAEMYSPKGSGNKVNNARKACKIRLFGLFLFVIRTIFVLTYCQSTYSVSISATSLCLLGYRWGYVFSVVFISLWPNRSLSVKEATSSSIK